MSWFKSNNNQKQVIKLSDLQEAVIDEHLEDDHKAVKIHELTGIDIVLIKRYINTLAKRKEREDLKQPINNELINLREDLKTEKLKHELNILQEMNALDLKERKLDIEIKEAELNGEFDEPVIPQSTDDLPGIVSFLTTLLNKNNNQQQHNQNVTPAQVMSSTPGETQATLSKDLKQDLSDERIMELIKEVELKDPDSMKLVHVLSEDKVHAYLKNNYDFSDNTIKRAIEMIKNGIKV